MAFIGILNEIVWEIDPEVFSVGIFSIRWYGLLFAASFVAGQFIITYIYKQEGLKEADVDSLVIYMVVSTILGARLGHCLFYQPDYYLANPLKILMVWEGGLASHGAAFGILFAIWLYCRKYKHNYIWLLDRIVITVALAGCFIRFGNFMNSEIIGVTTDVPWGVVFKSNPEAGILPRHPAQLYESISCLLLFIVLFGIYLKYKRETPVGLIFGIFLIGVFGLRFLYEFLKEVQVAFEGGMALNMGQILSIPLVLAGFYILYNAIKTGRKKVAV